MIRGIENYAIVLDIWRIGCIFGELYIKKPLFMGDSEIDQIFKMMQIYGTLNELTLPGYKSFPYFNPFWKGIGLKSYVNKKYGSLQMDDLAFDLLEKMLNIDPIKRITCKEALNHPFLKVLCVHAVIKIIIFFNYLLF